MMLPPLKNGGPAFPVPNLENDEDFNGMFLRDYLAAHAPFTQYDVINFAESAGEQINGPQLCKIMAYLRYQYADAMLAERSK